MLASMTLFFEPDWPSRLARFFRLIDYEGYVHITPGMPQPRPFQWLIRKRPPGPLTVTEILVLALLTVFVLHQIAVPLRHYTYTGYNVAWDDFGHKYSWRMKLRNKYCSLGVIAIDRATNKSLVVDAPSFLYGKQLRKVGPVPQLVMQFAHFVADVYVQQGISDLRPAVHVNVRRGHGQA